MTITKVVKKTNEELYEGNIRSDFSTAKRVTIAIILEDFYCILGSGYWKYGYA